MANEVVGLKLVCGGMLLFLENVASVPTIIKQTGSHINLAWRLTISENYGPTDPNARIAKANT